MDRMVVIDDQSFTKSHREIEDSLKIQALDIQVGNRILAYCNNKMQICTVRLILDPGLNTVTLSVSTSEHSRNSISRVIRFHRDALVDLAS
jgi:hypothetical protein